MNWRLTQISFIVLFFMLSSCVQVAKRDPKPPDLPAQFSQPGDQGQLPDWWLTFNDAGLTQAIETALNGNLDLLAAHDRLMQAEAVARRAGAAKYPELDGRGLAAETWTTRDETDSTTNLTLGLAASYEVDLWGRVRSRTEAALLDADAREADLQTVAITITSEIGSIWYQIAEIIKEQELVIEQRLLNEKILEIITAQFRAGQVGIADVMQQKQLIEGNNGELIVLKVRLFNLEQRLAILLGVMPGSTSLPRPVDLVELPPLPATGLPVELLAKRPDIQSAYLSLLASDQRVAEAVANKFPTLSLSADVSTGGEQASALFNNWISSLAANLVGPIFDGGFRQAEVDRTQAVASESFHRYGQTVLEAISEVETALILEQEQKQLIENLKIRLDLAEATVERVGDRYRQGAQDYQRVLTALLSFQGLQTELLRARQELIDFRIGLYRSLGGRIDLPEMTLAAGQISYGISDQEN